MSNATTESWRSASDRESRYGKSAVSRWRGTCAVSTTPKKCCVRRRDATPPPFARAGLTCGLVFVAAAVAVYGRNSGILVALLGALISATVSFAVVRAFAGRALADVQRPLIRRLLTHIDNWPVLTVALLRLIFQTAPPLNYALPMTAVRWRDHLVGSVLGLPVPVGVMAFFFDWLLHSRA